MTSAEWAAWVQAVGTILALAIAIAAPIIHERVKERSERKRLLTGITVTVTNAAGALNQAVHLCETPEGAAEYAEEFKQSHWSHIYRALDAFPIHTTNDQQLAFAVLEVQAFVQAAENIIGRAATISRSNHQERFRALEELKPIANVITDHLQKMEEARSRKAPWWRSEPDLKDIWDK